MASGGRGWKEDKSDGSGSWLWTGLKIGAALGAAALGAYAAVKVAEQEKEEPMKSYDTSRSSSSDDASAPHRGRASQPPKSRPNVPGAGPKPKKKASSNLMIELNEFYDMQINRYSDQQMAIHSFVGKTGQRISDYLVTNHRRLIKGDLTPAAIEGLFSPEKQTEFNWMLPLTFNPKMWEFIDGAETVLDTPGFFCVRRINLDFFPMGRSPWDRFLVGSYLCPELLVESLKKIFEDMIAERMGLEFYCNVTRRAGVVALNIENPVGGYAQMLSLDIIPCMQFKKQDKMVTITTRCPSPGQSKSSNPHENLWLQSQEEEAVQKLVALDTDGGCRRKCLAILDALRWTQPPVKMLSSHLLMTIVLNLCDEETEWEEEMLAERFLDLLKALEGYLRAGSLKDHFNDQVDILSQCCSPGIISEVQKWLAYILESKERISGLLTFD